MKTRRRCSSRESVFVMTVAFMLLAAMVLGVAGPSATTGSVQAAPAPGGSAAYVFQGTGRAHGVGMCMDGVHYRALAGQDYHSMMSYYYTNITFSKIDDARPVRVKGRDGQIRTWSMHDYLEHLQEEPNDSPMEELKCLYVAARTYTLSCIARNKHTAAGFDVCSSGECCQACDENKSVGAYPNNNKAVDDTAGEIATYDGQPITAAYCGSCGGHSENSEDAFGGTPIPYLRGKPDDFCKNSPRFAWKLAISKTDLEAKLNSASDTQVGTLYGIDLHERTPGGRVKKARLSGSLGNKTVTGQRLSNLLGMQSTKYDLATSNFDEYILINNPGTGPAAVTFTFSLPDGSTSEQKVQVGATSRYTMCVNDYVQFSEVSTKVTSDVPVIAERTMYFKYKDAWDGGTDAVGATTPGGTWFFAEGTTRKNFDSYVTMQNPNDQAVTVTLDYMLEGEGIKSIPVQLPATARATVSAWSALGADKDFSLRVTCPSPIVAERPMYFNYHGAWTGGHVVVGATSASKSYYFAEGYTGKGFEEWLCLQNPNPRDIKVQAAYMQTGDGVVQKEYTVPAGQRKTVSVNEAVGAGKEVSVALSSENEFVAERPMYFSYAGKRNLSYTGGHDVIGVVEPRKQFVFAEGYTGPGFDEWLCVQNPGDKQVDLDVTYYPENGATKQTKHSVAAKSRYTIMVNEDAGENLALSVKVDASAPVIVERPMYFAYKGAWTGGHDSNGAVPSKSWYFAEGYTGN